MTVVPEHAANVENQYRHLIKLMRHYLAFAQANVCTSCLRDRHQPLIDAFGLYLGHPDHAGPGKVAFCHHTGHFNRMVSPDKPLPFEDVRMWRENTGHGMFHGLCVGFQASLAYPTLYAKASLVNLVTSKESEHAATFAAALLHDYVKCIEGEGVVNHDSRLKSVFPRLPEFTFCHSKPKDPKNPLVAGDRMDLMRYGDHSDWVDHNMLKEACSTFSPELAQAFHTMIRPALLKLYKGRNEVCWIKHGAESRHPTLKAKELDLSLDHYPQSGSHMNVLLGIGEEGYSVDTMPGPFGNCFTHCLEYNIFGGVAPVSKFSRNADIVPCRPEHKDHDGFEHPCGRGYPQLDDWVFFYREPLDRNKYKDHVLNLLARGIAVIPADIGTGWVEVCRQLDARITALCVTGGASC